VLVHDRSRERAHLEAIRSRREALQRSLGMDEPEIESLPFSQQPPPNSDPRPWELAALVTEERRIDAIVEDLHFQIDALQRQLDSKNEDHEKALVKATGTLEGSLSALRHLTNEIARTIDDGIDMLQRAG
jgi:hypothetical protein